MGNFAKLDQVKRQRLHRLLSDWMDFEDWLKIEQMIDEIEEIIHDDNRIERTVPGTPAH
jgi:hypothetical protein